MARAEDRAESASDEGDALSGGSGDDSDSNSGSDYDSDGSAGGSNSDGSEDGEEEEDEDDEKAEEAAAAAAAAKKQLVRADIDEMRALIADMDAVKARLQQRFAAERQARLERIAREEHEREEQDADRRKAEQEAHGRHVEMAVQTEAVGPQQQKNLSQQGSCSPPHLAHSACVAAATLPAVDGGSGLADAAPDKGKPAGLSLYDLVKASGFGLSRKEISPVRQADPTRSANEHELVPPDLQQQQLHYEQPESATRQGWGIANSRLAQGRDSVVNGSSGDDGASDIHASSSRDRQQLQSKAGHTEYLNYDENSSSMSNSLASSTAGKRPALLPPRQDHKLNAAALLSSGRHDPTALLTNDKTDEQREMEAIQCLLFGRSRP